MERKAPDRLSDHVRLDSENLKALIHLQKSRILEAKFHLDESNKRMR